VKTKGKLHPVKTTFWQLFILLLLNAAFTAVAEEPKEFRVVGYVPTWTQDNVSDASLAQLTDVVMFSAQVTADGAFPPNPVSDNELAWYQDAQKKHGFRLHLCVGGWGRSAGFPLMAPDATKRAEFIGGIVKYCRENGIRGIDYDWEFPKNAEEKSAYDALIEDTHKAAIEMGLELSVALGWTQSLSARAYNAVDRINLMTYDMGARHSTYAAMKKTVERVTKDGVPAEKICVGVPFYGRKVDDEEVSKGYSQLVAEYQPKAHKDEAGGFYFNGAATIQRKSRYAKNKNLGGIMIWEISADTTDATSLLFVITEELK